MIEVRSNRADIACATRVPSIRCQFAKCFGAISLVAAAMEPASALTLQDLSDGGYFCRTVQTCVTRIDPIITESTSSTHQDIVTNVTLGGVTIAAPGSGPLQTQLGQILAGPNAGPFQTALSAVLGAPVTAFVGRQLTSLNATFTLEDTVGPGTIHVGEDRIVSYVVVAGQFNENINAAINYFYTDTFQATQTLTNRGVNWLSGDLHTTFQTTILDDDFRFTDLLLSRGRIAGVPGNTGPFAFASEAIVSSPFDNALAYAKSPMFTKARPLPLDTGIWSGWVSGEGGRSSVGGTANNFGFNARSASGTGGLDYATSHWLFGAAAGFGQAKVKQDTTLDSGTIDTVQGGVYGAWRPGPYTVSATLIYGHHQIDATRLALLPAPALSNYDANSFGGGLEVSTRRSLFGGTIEPLAGLVYNALRVNSFNEAGPFLAIAGNTANIAALKGYAGARLWRTFDAGAMQVTPEVRGRVLYDMLDDPRGFSASFIADPARVAFPVIGIQPDRLAERLGAGVNVRFNPVWRASLNYDAEFRGGDVAHFASGTIRATW
jgi:uncharacterized protein with beta-barrel porin domain